MSRLLTAVAAWSAASAVLLMLVDYVWRSYPIPARRIIPPAIGLWVLTLAAIALFVWG